MLKLAEIRTNDAQDGDTIIISAIEAEYDGQTGYRLHASNGDDIGHYRPVGLDHLRRDLIAMYKNWTTFELV